MGQLADEVAAQQERRDPADRPARQRRARRAQLVPGRRARCRGRPHRARPAPAPGRLADPPARDRASISWPSWTHGDLAVAGARDDAPSPQAGPGANDPGAALPDTAERQDPTVRPLTDAVPGRLFAGTSGFAYPAWTPALLSDRACAPADSSPTTPARLPAVELNNTYYQSPSADKVAAWLAATPPTSGSSVKAQRGGSFRSLGVDPADQRARG